MTNLPTDSTSLEIERLRIEAAATAQQRRIAFWSGIFSTVMGAIVSPLLLFYLHGQTVSKVDEVKAVANQAAEHAEQAATITAHSSAVLDQKVDANLKQWKAFNSREPEDMQEAAKSLARAERPMPPVEAAKEHKQ